jgi:phosphate transport system substrate-binding protein
MALDVNRASPDDRPSLAQTAVTGRATFPYPIYSKWFGRYYKLHRDIRINYQSIGSGGGIRSHAGTVDFAPPTAR